MFFFMEKKTFKSACTSFSPDKGDCRSPKMLKNSYLAATIAVDAAENKPKEVGTNVLDVSRIGHKHCMWLCSKSWCRSLSFFSLRSWRSCFLIEVARVWWFLERASFGIMSFQILHRFRLWHHCALLSCAKRNLRGSSLWKFLFRSNFRGGYDVRGRTFILV